MYQNTCKTAWINQWFIPPTDTTIATNESVERTILHVACFLCLILLWKETVLWERVLPMQSSKIEKSA